MKTQFFFLVVFFSMLTFTTIEAVTPSTGRTVVSFTLKTEITEGRFFFRGGGRD